MSEIKEYNSFKHFVESTNIYLFAGINVYSRSKILKWDVKRYHKVRIIKKALGKNNTFGIESIGKQNIHVSRQIAIIWKENNKYYSYIPDPKFEMSPSSVYPFFDAGLTITDYIMARKL